MWKQRTSEARQENTELNFEQICEDDRVRVEEHTVEKLRPLAEVSKSKRCGKTRKETHANHKKVNQKVKGQTKMNCL